MKYSVTITETLQRAVEVEANSKEAAEEMVNEQWYAGDQILDADDFKTVDFEAEQMPVTKLRIYQVNTERDKDRIAFMEYDSLEKFQGNSNINSSVYDRVYEYETDVSSLEDIYKLFNISRPQDYKGRSLSVSDVVEIVSSDKLNPGFYFCDTVGFKKVDFDVSGVTEVTNCETIKVILLEPNKLARTVEIGTELEDYQSIVNGSIEIFYPFAEEVCMVVNEEGKINGMPLNRAVYDRDNNMIDIIAGTAFICDCSTEKLKGLSEEQQKKYLQLFKFPERFVRVNGDIQAVKFNPKEAER